MIEGTYDAVGMNWKSGTVPTEVRNQLQRLGWFKIGSVRYADVLVQASYKLGNPRLSATAQPYVVSAILVFSST